MEVRPLKTEDIPQVIHLGGLMHDESQYSALEFDPGKVAETCYHVIQDQMSACFVAESDGKIIGMMAAYIAPYSYGNDLVALDLLVFVSPEHRGGSAFVRLAMAYVDWAKSKKVSMVFLTQTTGTNQEKVARIYGKLGFECVGGFFRLRN